MIGTSLTARAMDHRSTVGAAASFQYDDARKGYLVGSHALHLDPASRVGNVQLVPSRVSAAETRWRVPAVLVIVAQLVVWTVQPTSGAGGQRAVPQQGATDVLRVPPNDPLTRDHIQRAIAGSSTFREVVARVEQLHDTVLILRGHPLLLSQEALLGRGRFWVVRGHLYGLLEYQSEQRGSERPPRIIAHELAHALEVALAPRGLDTASLRPFVLAREQSEATVTASGVETEFARAVGYRVGLEILGRLRGPSSLSTLADQTHLALGVTAETTLPSWMTSPAGSE